MSVSAPSLSAQESVAAQAALDQTASPFHVYEEGQWRTYSSQEAYLSDGTCWESFCRGLRFYSGLTLFDSYQQVVDEQVNFYNRKVESLLAMPELPAGANFETQDGYALRFSQLTTNLNRQINHDALAYYGNFGEREKELDEAFNKLNCLAYVIMGVVRLICDMIWGPSFENAQRLYVSNDHRRIDEKSEVIKDAKDECNSVEYNKMRPVREQLYAHALPLRVKLLPLREDRGISLSDGYELIFYPAKGSSLFPADNQIASLTVFSFKNKERHDGLPPNTLTVMLSYPFFQKADSGDYPIGRFLAQACWELLMHYNKHVSAIKITAVDRPDITDVFINYGFTKARKNTAKVTEELNNAHNQGKDFPERARPIGPFSMTSFHLSWIDELAEVFEHLKGERPLSLDGVPLPPLHTAADMKGSKKEA